MNFLELVQKVCRETDVQAPTGLTNPSNNVQRIMDFVNEAYNFIWLELGNRNEDAESETVATLAGGSSTYSAPYNQITMVAWGNDPPLRILPWLEFEANYKRASILAVDMAYPGVCSIHNRTIHFYPKPSEAATITIRGRQSFFPLSEDTSEPDLQEDYHTLIKAFAVGLAYKYDHDLEAYQMQAQYVAEYLSKVRRQMRAHWGIPPRVMTEEEFLPYDIYGRVRASNA